MTAAARASARIFVGVALATTGVYSAVVLAPVLGSELTGSTFMAGLPVAALLAGAGVGAAVSARVIRRSGRRAALVASYLLGAAACVLAVLAVTVSLFWLFLVAMLGVGAGHAANQLARYAAAELFEPARRPTVIGWIIWAQAVGAVVGPLLLQPASTVAGALAFLPETGPYGLAAALFLLAAGMHLIGEQRQPAVEGRPGELDAHPDLVPVTPGAAGAALVGAPSWSRPAVQVAAATLITSQVVMLLLMSITPVHAQHGGHGLAAVGTIISAHTLGMFALAPLAGRLVARHGSVPMIGAGLGLLLAGALWSAGAPAHSQAQLGGALFLLGLGWSVSFVAASALLARGTDPEERARLQARVEAVTWVSGAAASVAAGLLLGLVGFALLGVLGAVLVAVPVLVIGRHRRAVTAPAA